MKNIEPIDKRFLAFGATVVVVNGHNIEELFEASKNVKKTKHL